MGVEEIIPTSPVTEPVRARVYEVTPLPLLPLSLFLPVPLTMPLAVNAAVKVPVTEAPTLLLGVLVAEPSALEVGELE